MDLDKQAEVLNDLVKINNDRVEGYKRAVDELEREDTDLKPVFQEKIDQSTRFHSELATQVSILGEDVATGTMASGKIYRAWMDVKAFVTGSDRKAVLASCITGEEAAVVAYDSALKSDHLTPDLRQLLTEHLSVIRGSLSEIIALRDALK